MAIKTFGCDNGTQPTLASLVPPGMANAMPPIMANFPLLSISAINQTFASFMQGNWGPSLTVPKLPGGLTVTAIPAAATKEWQVKFGQTMRNLFVYVLVKCFASTKNLASLPHAELVDILEYARETEEEYFTTSNTRSEYYLAIGENFKKK